MDKEPYVKPDVKTVILEPEALCSNFGSGGGSINQGPSLFFTSGGGGGGGGGLGGLGGSTGEGPSVGGGGSGVR